MHILRPRNQFHVEQRLQVLQLGFVDLYAKQVWREVDKTQLKDLQPLLDVKLVSWPQYVQVLNTTPEKVEYLIVQ